MSLDLHTVEVVDGSVPARQDRVILALLPGTANAAGGGAGLAVTVPVSGLSLPSTYTVLVDPGQDATWFVAPGSKTNSGFTVTLNPRLAANTLASGTIDIIVLA